MHKHCKSSLIASCDSVAILFSPCESDEFAPGDTLIEVGAAIEAVLSTFPGVYMSVDGFF